MKSAIPAVRCQDANHLQLACGSRCKLKAVHCAGTLEAAGGKIGSEIRRYKQLIIFSATHILGLASRNAMRLPSSGDFCRADLIVPYWPFYSGSQ